MLVSIVIPAFNAEPTIARAVRSALAQTHRDLEVIIVSDDGRDYVALLSERSITDPRLRQLSTGKNGSGCHRARNLGLRGTHGELVTHFDADDVMRPEKIARLLPLARHHGAAFDAVDVIDDRDDSLLYTALGGQTLVDLDGLFESATPLTPLVRRDCAITRVDGIDLAEDVVANLQLIDRLGPLPVVGEALSEYRVVDGSMSHTADPAARYDEHYGLILTMLPMIPLSPTTRPRAHQGFTAKRELNRAYGEARAKNTALTFQHYIAALRRGEHL
ncbi:MAG: glycosyltransferase family 2 protein [Myxococcota bacterium]|nr:glycosyltransferase family 2 protein [Myxococcota bacterium]